MFEKLIQVGFVSRESKRIMENFINIYNIGPWYVLKYHTDNVKSMTVYGEKREYSMNVAVCPIGDVRFEYIEPIKESIFSDFYNIHNEKAVHHIKLGVNDYKETLNFFNRKNIDLIQVGHQLGGPGKNIFHFFDTQEKLGFITEIVSVTEDFIKPQPDYWFPSETYNLSPSITRPSMVGIVVKNIEEKIKDYEILSIKSWQIKDFNSENDLSIKVKMAFCRLGNIVIKLIEPVSDSIFYDFLSKNGEGIHHIKMEVDNYEKTLEYLLKKDLKIIYSDNYKGEINFSFLDSDKHFNFIIELSDRKLTENSAVMDNIHP